MGYLGWVGTEWPSQLEYASGLLITASKTQLEKLNRIQKSAARIILGAPRLAHSAPLIEQLGLQSLEERRMDHVFNIVRSIIEGNCHPAIRNYFSTVTNGSIVPRTLFRTNIGKKSFLSRAVSIWDCKSRHFQLIFTLVKSQGWRTIKNRPVFRDFINRTSQLPGHSIRSSLRSAAVTA